MSTTARWWRPEAASIRCLLCPHTCVLGPGERGLCGVREAGEHLDMRLPAYGLISASGLDPIEKKPLYHFFPGQNVWSIGFLGCSMHCPFCQNYRIADSSVFFETARAAQRLTPEQVVRAAVGHDAHMIAYTYSEPTVHFEYLMECAALAGEKGLENVLVTNGMLNRRPARELLDMMDAVNVDVKSWSSSYYRDVLGGRLATVCSFIEEAAARCWVELTTLIVPGENDSDAAMRGESEWIAAISPDIPLHLSAYHPAHRYTNSNKPNTSWESLIRLRELASESLNYVYTGNIGIENPTSCVRCGTVLIERRGFAARSYLRGSVCPECAHKLPGMFQKPGGLSHASSSPDS